MTTRWGRLAAVVSLLAAGSTAAQQLTPAFRTWAATPPIGWTSWDCYGPTVTEAETKANADYMAKYLEQFSG